MEERQAQSAEYSAQLYKEVTETLATALGIERLDISPDSNLPSLGINLKDAASRAMQKLTRLYEIDAQNKSRPPFIGALREEDFAIGTFLYGKLTLSGKEGIRSRFPHVDVSELEGGLTVDEVSNRVDTVASLLTYIQQSREGVK